jgi:hypothetical protein
MDMQRRNVTLAVTLAGLNAITCNVKRQKQNFGLKNTGGGLVICP